MIMWIDEYIEMMIRGDIKNALSLKNEHMPMKLYRYRSVTKYSLNDIKNNTIWLSNASEFNDPFDSTVAICGDTILNGMAKNIIEKHPNEHNLSDAELKRLKSSPNRHEELTKIIVEKDPQFHDPESYPTITAKMMQIFKNECDKMISYSSSMWQKSICVCSFTTRIDSIRMWSLYADSHKGFCIEYEIDSDDFKNMLFPVIYSEKRFDVTENYGSDDRPTNLYTYIPAMHKLSEWSDEKEWRIISHISVNNGNILGPTIRSITLGSKISSDDETEIIEIANKRGIECYKMKVSNADFKLISEKIN